MAERIHGPYKHRAKWRVIGVGADGSRIRQSFDSYEEARAFIQAAQAALGHRTIGSAVNAYLEHLRSKGRRPSTLATARYRLLGFFHLTESDPLLASLTPAVARAIYARRVAETKANTHRAELILASAVMAYSVKQGWAAEDPFTGVEPEGVKAVGGELLRVDEARRFLSAALAEGSPSGLACALALLTGARASEVTERTVRDLDDGGRRLWITQAKTAAGVRQLSVPEIVRAGVLELVRGRGPTDRLWGDVTRHWLGHHVRRFCEAAGVPVVGPHGLRRTYATLRVGTHHAATEAVARELGQAGPAVTERHYVAPGTVDLVASALAQQILTPGVGNKSS